MSNQMLRSTVEGMANTVLTRTDAAGFNKRAVSEPNIHQHFERLGLYLLMWDQIRSGIAKISADLGIDAPAVGNEAPETVQKTMEQYATPEQWDAESRVGLLFQIISLRDRMNKVLAWIQEVQRKFPDRSDVWGVELSVEVTQENIGRKLMQIVGIKE